MMSQIKDIARGLSANGAAASPTIKGHYLLYTNTGQLVAKRWTGGMFEDEQLVSSSVRRNSTAGYVALARNKSLAVAVTSDSKLAVFHWCGEDGEESKGKWTQDSTLPVVTVHPSGKLATTVWQDRVRIVVQAAGGELVQLFKLASGAAWLCNQLSTAVTPLAGTALAFLNPGADVFYISGVDQKIHGLYESEGWADSVFADAQVDALEQVFVVSGGTKETVAAYGITPENEVIQILAGGEKVVLGDVGMLVSRVKAEYSSSRADDSDSTNTTTNTSTNTNTNTITFTTSITNTNTNTATITNTNTTRP